MKIVVIGGVAGGASAAARARRLSEEPEILIFEKDAYVSFSNCAMPYYLGGDIESAEDLVLMDPEDFKKRFRIEVRTLSEVTAIDRAAKTVHVRERNTGREYDESYDRLILSTGAVPERPEIPGIEREHVFTLRNVEDVSRIHDYVNQSGARSVAVIGGGFIGIELAENLKRTGKEVFVIGAGNQVLRQFDFDMVQYLQKELLDHGIRLLQRCTVCEIGEGAVRLSKDGKEFEIPADAVVVAKGVKPEVKLAKAAGLAIGTTGGVRVDASGRTSDETIYCVGDAAEKYNVLLHKPGLLSPAGPAQFGARAAADDIFGESAETKGYIGSSCLRVFDLNAACTGLNERELQKAGIPYDFAYVLPSDKVSLMPDSHYMAFKLLFETPTGRILGAQAIGPGDAVGRVNVVAALIRMNGTLRDLKDLELCYSPVYSTPKDVVNFAALVGLNVLSGRVRQVPVSAVRGLVKQGACIIDVREKGEYDRGHIRGALNIPLSELRERADEVPEDVPVYLHCRTSQRSYYAACFLQGTGHTNVFNISGSFLGLCLYEYAQDVLEEREPIVTAYNFR